MEEKSKYIASFQVQKMWQRVDIRWNNIHQDVNILVGINGCGKTTLLNLISDYYSGQKIKKNIAEAVSGTAIDSPVTYIRSFDIPANAKRKTESMLLQSLKNIINQNGEGTSFFDYRMKMLNFPEKAEIIRKRIDNFFQLVNSLFEETGKEIRIDPQNNTLVFSIIKGTGRALITSDGQRVVTANGDVIRAEDEKIQLDQLSSGEKQILLILTTVFLQEEKPAVLLMDEPEISLHITWQDRLIELIRKLNPNCQLILTTHSPNIFANGWEDKIVFIQDLEER
ncbi:ATP-binding protein [uncultured Bacteroides sp.]|uniref:AAA family ATPase n=1 Tax=uncultured Bacteroides sp. TaxID=162156 RepID=UPI00280C0B34|nr:ATP-binding protein [uncultured Bacteroides sp.]